MAAQLRLCCFQVAFLGSGLLISCHDHASAMLATLACAKWAACCILRGAFLSCARLLLCILRVYHTCVVFPHVCWSPKAPSMRCGPVVYY